MQKIQTRILEAEGDEQVSLGLTGIWDNETYFGFDKSDAERIQIIVEAINKKLRNDREKMVDELTAFINSGSCAGAADPRDVKLFLEGKLE